MPNTFIATTEAISQAGARPDFVDIDERTYNMDPGKLRQYLEKECSWDSGAKRAFHKQTGNPVTAVIPVHLYGQMADMDPILDLATQYNLKVIEDACQAQGAEYFSQEGKPLAQGWVHGPCGGVQLLSRQELGRMRRGRRYYNR